MLKYNNIHNRTLPGELIVDECRWPSTGSKRKSLLNYAVRLGDGEEGERGSKREKGRGSKERKRERERTLFTQLTSVLRG